MNIADRPTMLRIIANVTTLFWPCRGPGLAEILYRRRMYRTDGVSWLVGGEASDRQQGHLQLKRLQLAGLIRIHRGKANNARTGVSLRAIDRCLSMVDFAPMAEVWWILERLAGLYDDAETSHQDGRIIEHHAVGFDFNTTDGRPAAIFASKATPLLIAGFVETMCDTRGTLGWKLTDAGRDAMEDGPPEATDLIEYDPAIEDEYAALETELLSQRNSWKPTHPNDLGIPMSAGMWLTNARWDEKRRAAVDG